MRAEGVLKGFEKYVEKAMFPSMLNWQRVAVRTMFVRIKNNNDVLIKVLPIFNFFDYVDDNGEVDVNDFISDLAEAVHAEGHLEIAIDMLGLKYKLSSKDIEELGYYLRGDK